MGCIDHGYQLPRHTTGERQTDGTDAMSDIVPFGNKYRGQPVEVMLADPGYLAFCRARPRLMAWLQQHHVTIYNFITVAAPQNDDTPEHNGLQVRFYDAAF